MELAKVRAELEVIYLELEHLESSDVHRIAAVRDQLGQVIANLPSGETEGDELSPSEQLRAAVTRFESEHPTLARTTEEVINALSRMGI
ncbi:conserved hypothetical protein [gamma proteobacterium HTCC5015]|nr:conserved hypothetical protein [gamma proteobacterium HTCC5015]